MEGVLGEIGEVGKYPFLAIIVLSLGATSRPFRGDPGLEGVWEEIGECGHIRFWLSSSIVWGPRLGPLKEIPAWEGWWGLHFLRLCN